MTGEHRKPQWTVRRVLPFVAIVAGLLMVAVTYPRPTSEGVVMPPGQQGVYSNYDQPVPSAVETAGQ